MKEELYLWIRNLAVFYIFFTAVLNLIPDQKYEKYVRFFMGLLLIFMMSTPIFSILGKGSELTDATSHQIRNDAPSSALNGNNRLWSVPNRILIT